MKEEGQFKRLAAELEHLVSSAFEQLEPFDDIATGKRPSTDTWSQKEILGHLVDSASNNHQRFVRALSTERLLFPPYAQEPWVERQHYNRINWRQLLAFWRHYNLHLAHIIMHMPDDKMAVPCSIDPDDPVSLGFLVEDYLAHMRLHFEQLGLDIRFEPDNIKGVVINPVN